MPNVSRPLQKYTGCIHIRSSSADNLEWEFCGLTKGDVALAFADCLYTMAQPLHFPQVYLFVPVVTGVYVT